MRVGRAFMTLNSDWLAWKSTSLSGWEYFNCVRGLGFKSYVYNCVLFNYYCFNDMINHVSHYTMLELY